MEGVRHVVDELGSNKGSGGVKKDVHIGTSPATGRASKVGSVWAEEEGIIIIFSGPHSGKLEE